MRRTSIITTLVLVMILDSAAVALADGDATCGGVVGEVHGHHVVADYVTGIGHDNLDWPPAGGANAAGRAAVPGGPGPGYHFPNGFAPGASFCTDSQSPGIHL